MQQIMENLGAIRKSKSVQCKFGSILVCILFYAQNKFPSFGKLGWKTNMSISMEINQYIEEMGDNLSQ